MRVVFNYRQAFREPKRIQQLTDGYSLPFAIELVPTINFLVFMAITGLVMYLVRLVFPFTFELTFVIILIGVPLFLTVLMRKVNPDGKNIYLYLFGLLNYFVRIKLTNKRFCNDRAVEWMDDKKIMFRKCVEVVRRKDGRVTNAYENNAGEPIIDENGRRLGVSSSTTKVHS
ncbi:conjugal transfer protein [Salicibibacter kimchii]|uniref:Conjugal transfer protein n=1 Tax=Salicibibacter kimchii TaxID=2099786 RepID=A0A345C2J7_9BACI|nr:conjugal transfer protein [Salicibibacter kimchii]AXF57428.1 conjugal transfer protein [Salicibibacter kimchii]